MENNFKKTVEEITLKSIPAPSFLAQTTPVLIPITPLC